MSRAADELKQMDYGYVVEVVDFLSGEWIEYAKFKEYSAAENFIRYYQIRDIVTNDELKFKTIMRIREV